MNRNSNLCNKHSIHFFDKLIFYETEIGSRLLQAQKSNGISLSIIDLYPFSCQQRLRNSWINVFCQAVPLLKLTLNLENPNFLENFGSYRANKTLCRRICKICSPCCVTTCKKLLSSGTGPLCIHHNPTVPTSVSTLPMGNCSRKL